MNPGVLIMAKKTILVIEDNELNMKLVNSLLQIGQYDKLNATNAESGIQIAKEQRPDLILMDIQLPGMDGLSATRIIKRDPALKGIRIVALTGCAMEEEVEKIRIAGCDGYLSKPFEIQKFFETLNSFFLNRHEEDRREIS